jgi:hypothetical protein
MNLYWFWFADDNSYCTLLAAKDEESAWRSLSENSLYQPQDERPRRMTVEEAKEEYCLRAVVQVGAESGGIIARISSVSECEFEIFQRLSDTNSIVNL